MFFVRIPQLVDEVVISLKPHLISRSVCDVHSSGMGGQHALGAAALGASGGERAHGDGGGGAEVAEAGAEMMDATETAAEAALEAPRGSGHGGGRGGRSGEISWQAAGGLLCGRGWQEAADVDAALLCVRRARAQDTLSAVPTRCARRILLSASCQTPGSKSG